MPSAPKAREGRQAAAQQTPRAQDVAEGRVIKWR